MTIQACKIMAKSKLEKLKTRMSSESRGKIAWFTGRLRLSEKKEILLNFNE